MKTSNRKENVAYDMSQPWLQKLTLLALLLVIGLYAFSPLEDYDFWWHLKVGEIIYQTGDIVREDIFSFTSPGAHWIDHSWLSELAIYGAWRAGGVTGVLLLKVIILVTAFYFLQRALSRGVWQYAPTFYSLVPLLVTVGAAAATKVGWDVRPQTFSYLFFTLFLFLLEAGKGRYLLPLIMILWANSHGSFFFGLIILGAYLLEALFKYYRLKIKGSNTSLPSPELKTLALTFLAVLVASLINPHPLKLYAWPLVHLHQVFPAGIAEWARPTLTDTPAFWGFLLLTLLALPLAVKKIRLSHLLLFLVFIYPGLRYLRNVPYLTLAVAPLLCCALTESLGQAERIWPGLSRPLDKPPKKPFNPRYLLSAVFLLFALISWGAGWSGQGGVNYRRFPQKAVDFYQQAGVKGPLFNTYDWGGYLTYRLWPGEKVFILGITSDEEIFRQYYHISQGQKFWRALLDRYRINAILTKTCYSEGGMIPYIAKLYLDPDWWLIYQDDTACLLVRATENNRQLERYRLPKADLFRTVLAEERPLAEKKPPNPHALYYSALAHYVQGDRIKAQKNIDALLRLYPASVEAKNLITAMKANKAPQEFLQEIYGR